MATHRRLGALFVENFAQKHRPGRASAVFSARVRESPAGLSEDPARRCNAVARVYVCERKEERGGCQAVSPPPLPPPSLGPSAPLVDGDGAIIPRQFFSNASSLCSVDAGTAILFLSSIPVCSSFRHAFSLLPFYYSPSLILLRALPSRSFGFVRACLFSILVSSDRSFAFSRSSCSKNNRVEGRAAKRDGKDESNKEGEILERGDKRRRRGVSVSSSLRGGTRGSISGGGNFSRRGGDEHQCSPSSPPIVSIFVRFSFCSAAIDDSITSAKGRENAANGGRWGNGRGLFDIRRRGTRESRREAIVQLVKQTEPSSFSSLRATCVARTCLAILEMRPVRFI